MIGVILLAVLLILAVFFLPNPVQLPPDTPAFQVGETIKFPPNQSVLPHKTPSSCNDYFLPIILPDNQLYSIDIEPSDADCYPISTPIMFKIDKILVNPKLKQPEIIIINKKTDDSNFFIFTNAFIRYNANIYFPNSQSGVRFLEDIKQS
jgi:hypothetical protein